MSARTLRSIAIDQRILGALESGPLSAREISEKLIAETREAWAESEGLSVDELEAEGWPSPTRLMAFAAADRLGVPFVHSWEADSRLRRMERKGQVQRIQIEGRRPMLWMQCE